MMGTFTVHLRSVRRLGAVASVLLAVVPVGAAALGSRSRVPAVASPGRYVIHRACVRAQRGRVGCMMLELDPLTTARSPRGTPAATAIGGSATGCLRPREGCEGLRPVDLHSAYGLPWDAPVPQTIAIIGVFDDSRIEKDLEVYDTEFELPACTRENGCFLKLDGQGRRHPLPAPSSETSKETSLDVEVAHAVCQNCKIVLVEAASTALEALEEAVETAASVAGADEISISVGGPEPASVPRGGAAFDHPGIVITASSGDTGYLNWDSEEAERGGTEYPASSPYVIAVGGTHLTLGASGERAQETLWTGSGSGCSALFAAPLWQEHLEAWPSVGCGGQRAVADVAVDGDPATGAMSYDSVKDGEGVAPQWRRGGGTSLGAPLVAAAFALAGGAHGVAYPARTLYEDAASNPASLHDILEGSNGECAKLLGCTSEEEGAACGGAAICVAGPGYDGPTGLGSPIGLGPLLVRRTQTIAFSSTPPTPALAGGSPYALAAVATSGLPVAFSSATPTVCEVQAGAVRFLAAGTCVVAAEQAGSSEWEAAPQARQTIAVAAPETVTGGAGVLSFSASGGTAAGSGVRLLSAPSVDSRTGSVSFTLRVAGPGEARWQLTFANGSFGVLVGRSAACRTGWRAFHGRCRPTLAVYASGAESLAVSGTFKLTAHPDPDALRALKRALARRRGLRVQALVTFQPHSGGAQSRIGSAVTVRLSRR
jgi:hypothetical protein